MNIKLQDFRCLILESNNKVGMVGGLSHTEKQKERKEVFLSNMAAVEKPLHTVKFKSSSHFQWTILKAKSTCSTIHLGKIFRFQSFAPAFHV